MKEATRQSLDALSRGINAELAAYVFYKRAAEKVDDHELSEMLVKLAGEEKDHYWILEAEHDSLIRSEKWVTYNDIMRKNGLPEIPEEMAESHKRRIDALESVGDAARILQMALELEQEARDLYQSQLDNIDDPVAKEIYEFLVRFEQAHINHISKRLERF